MAKQSGNSGSGHLSRGSNVEVRSEEEGFNGAWFPATIIEPPSNPSPSPRKRKSFNSNKVLVQYDTFVSDDDPSKPLIEHANVMFVRPSPQVEDAGKKFWPGDDVDAFHNDAWWPGVVMSVEGDRYTVGFKKPPELLVLGRNELRTRLDWHSGVWSRAPKEPMKGSIYSPGTPIEVNLKKDHLWYAWIPASYAGELGGDSFLVQYKSGKTSDSHGLATVAVADHQIRPRPPLQEETNFCLMDNVDAFHDMGWWVGDITKVLTDKKYIVTFRFTREEKEFTCSQLRRHYEWIARKWITDVSEFQSTVVDKAQTRHALTISRNSAVATPLKSSRATKDSSAEEKPYAISQKNQMKQLGPCIDKSAYGKITKELKIPQQPNDHATFLSPTPSKKLKREHSEGSFSVDEVERSVPVKKSSEKGPVRDGEKTGPLFVESNSKAVSSVRKRGRTIKSQFDGHSPPLKIHVAVKKSSRMDNSDEECIGDGHVMDDIESYGIWSDSEVMGRSLALLPMKVINEHDKDGLSSGTKAKGKIPDILVEHLKGLGADCTKNVFKSTALRELGFIDLRGSQPENSSEKHRGIGVVVGVELPNSKVAEYRGSEDSTRNGTAEASAMEVQVTVPGLSSKPAAHDQLISLCVDEMHSEYTMECSGIPAATTNQQIPVADAGLSGKTPAVDQPLSLSIDEMHSEKTLKSSCSEDPTRNGRAEASAMEVWEDGAEISANKPAQDQPLSFYIDGMDSENTMKGSGNLENLVSEAGISVKTPAHDQSLPLCIDKAHSEKTMEGSSSKDPTGDGKAEASAMEIEVAGTGISAETPPHDKPLPLCIVEMDSENSGEGLGNPAGTANQQSPVDGAGSANEPLQDQPLSLCIGERYSGKTMEGSSNPAESANQQYEVRGRRVETGITGDIEREEGPHLPFVKKSPFWKMLESMDAFKRFPQQPHFKPLLKMKMVCREALALGGMHMFSSLVEYTSQLQVDDLSDSINDILEALVEMERLGFDVEALRNHVNELQDMKLRFEQLTNKLNLVEIQITNCRHERSKGSEVISGLDKEINDLEEQIRGIQEKRAKAVSEREAKDSEISAIQSEANAITESIQSIEHDFQNLAATAW